MWRMPRHGPMQCATGAGPFSTSSRLWLGNQKQAERYYWLNQKYGLFPLLMCTPATGERRDIKQQIWRFGLANSSRNENCCKQPAIRNQSKRIRINYCNFQGSGPNPAIPSTGLSSGCLVCTLSGHLAAGTYDFTPLTRKQTNWDWRPPSFQPKMNRDSVNCFETIITSISFIQTLKFWSFKQNPLPDSPINFYMLKIPHNSSKVKRKSVKTGFRTDPQAWIISLRISPKPLACIFHSCQALVRPGFPLWLTRHGKKLPPLWVSSKGPWWQNTIPRLHQFN